MSFGLCVVGCGRFAGIFAKSIQPLLPNINLYFASRNLDKAQNYSIFNGSGAFGSYKDAASSPDVHAMYICTPHSLHMEHMDLAASYGKHVLIEKPLASTLDDGLRIISIAQKTGVTLMVAENYRFMPAVRLCKQLVDQGRIGDIRVIQVQQESPYLPSDWRKDRKMNGGGVFIDAGIHKIHFLRYLLGEPQRVYSIAPGLVDISNYGEDGLIFTAKWDKGAVGLIYHSWTSSRITSPHWISVSGTEGKIYFEIGESTLKLERDLQSQTFDIAEPYNGLLPMVSEFLTSIESGNPPEMTGEEGLNDLIIVEKAYESAHKHTEVLVNSS